MFPAHLFALRFFPQRYFPKIGETAAVPGSIHRIFRQEAQGSPDTFRGSQAPASGKVFRQSLTT